MHTFLKTLTLAGLLASVTSISQALTHTYSDVDDALEGWRYDLVTGREAYTGNFSYKTPGTDECFVAAQIKLAFVDDDCVSDWKEPEKVKVTIAGHTFDLGDVDGTMGRFLWWTWYDYDWETIGLGSSFWSLLKTGGFSYTVSVGRGQSTYLKEAEFCMTTKDCPPTRVPDGGETIALLGVSLLGLAALGRRFRS